MQTKSSQAQTVRTERKKLVRALEHHFDLQAMEAEEQNTVHSQLALLKD
jgi:hypothetical protein